MLQRHVDGVGVVGDAVVDGDASVLVPVNLLVCLMGVAAGNSDLKDLTQENTGYKT